jgi:hypothetical protein
MRSASTRVSIARAASNSPIASKELRNRVQQRLQAHALPHQIDIRKADLPRRRSRHGSALLALRGADPLALQRLDFVVSLIF